MEIRVRAVNNPTCITRNNNLQVTRFTIDFENPCVSGTAHLFVTHSSPRIDIDLIRQQVIGRTIQVEVSCDKIYDFTVISGAGQEHIRLSGASEGFFLEGRIVEHLFTGEGSVFQTRDASMIISVDMLPPYSLEVEVGTWVSFKTESLNFWLR